MPATATMSSSAARTSRAARYAASSARAALARPARYAVAPRRHLAALTRPTRASLQPRRHLAALTKAPGRTALYDPQHERDNCGVGLVADINKNPSRVILTDCNEMLVRMSHRGGCGCDPQSGDGAGMLVAMPDAFMRKHSGFELPAQGDYAVAMCFLPQDEANADRARKSLERASRQRGLGILGWRVLETDNSDLGEAPLASEPRVEQLFLTKKQGWDARKFDQELYRAQAVAQLENFQIMSDEGVGEDAVLYINSMSPHQITYKGQLTPEQVLGYFSGDLLRDDFHTHLALVHSRFSTNTFPSWSRAQPLRQMCHNGEINTLRGNKNWMRAREGLLKSPYLGDDTAKLLPVTSDEMSDSGNFDGVLQLLTNESAMSLPEAAMIMVPEAWQDNDGLTDEKKAFYEYHSCLMEPWDGPSLIAFTDSNKWIGATLDRNGLRPARYYETHDGRVLVSSEVGVVPWVKPEEIKVRSRLEPGKMFLVDLEEGRIIPDDEIKNRVASQKPYQEWLSTHTKYLSDWASSQKPAAFDYHDETTARRLVMHGYTTETMETLLAPMAIGGKEGFGSMGNDAALACLSAEPRPVSDYFKQLFAQVTNPPIDPIREELVMSLVCPVGPESNLLDAGENNCARLVVEHPVLTPEELAALQDDRSRDGWSSATVDATFSREGADQPLPSPDQYGQGSDSALERALADLCERAARAVQGSYGRDGAAIIILSDALAGPDRLPIPTLLAVGAVHQHLLKTGQRGKAALFADCGDVKEVHDVALAVGFGADGVCPRVAYEALAKLRHDGLIHAKMRNDIPSPDDVPDDAEIRKAYRKALAKGLLKVMSKMGISTLQSYKGAQIFEALGLHPDVVETCFSGTPSRIGGASFDAIQRDVVALHDHAWGSETRKRQTDPAGAWTGVNHEDVPQLPNPGQFHYRNGGEVHLNTPMGMVSLQAATKSNSRDTFLNYCREVDEVNAKSTLRGMLRWRPDVLDKSKVSLDDVEPAKEIVKRFVTGAMSLGSISKESHEALAVAMNTLGGKSNTGEGGEDPVRFGDNRRSSIKQVASGRFGVTSHYLANSDQIQIKMAQGAKPGEGGELPGFKVSDYIAECRGTTPGVGLISPPPHHDIYSIEDLAQLIHDLKCANPEGEVSVKLVSEVGVGVIAAGVAKAKADHIVVSGGDGGTGAAAWTGIKCAGLPWELGIAETQQTLVLNDLRDRVRLQTDGQLKTPRDICIAAALGAEEYALSTGPLIALGCIMMRKCHLNTCPVGIATQDPELRAKFEGQPEHVINFFFLLAEEMRRTLQSLGMTTMDELVGAAGDVLEVDPAKLRSNGRPDKAMGLDLAPLLQSARELNPTAGYRHTQLQDHELGIKADNELMDAAHSLIETYAKGGSAEPIVIERETNNLDRTLGTMLSAKVSKACGKPGLPDDAVRIKLEGSSGQSLGFALAPGITIEVIGDANDGCGKGLSGGRVIVRPNPTQLEGGHFVPSENVIVGNVACYGATAGEAFFRGVGGERFCVRNSGALAVVEGVGDHGCEYMTGGRMVCLGKTGRNFAAGMSGGIAYVLDPERVFADKCNMGMVELGPVEGEDADELRGYIEKHVAATESSVGADLLSDWDSAVSKFVRVMPTDYKAVLEKMKAEEDLEATA